MHLYVVCNKHKEVVKAELDRLTSYVPINNIEITYDVKGEKEYYQVVAWHEDAPSEDDDASKEEYNDEND